MLEKYLRKGNFHSLMQSVENGENCSVFGLNIGEKLALVEDSAFLFYVAENLEKASAINEKLLDLGRRSIVLQDFINPLSSEFESPEKILEILSGLNSGQLDTIVLTPNVLSAKFPRPEDIKKICVSKGQELNVSEFSRTLTQMGYSRVDLVSNKGEYSLHGDVIDVYPLLGNPTRIMTDFDVVESIRLYNPITLLTTSELESVDVLSNQYYNVRPCDIESYYSDNKLKKDDLFYALTETEFRDYRLIAFDKNINSSIFDFVDNGIIVFDGAKAIYDNLEQNIKDYELRIENSTLNKVLGVRKNTIKDYLKFAPSFTLLAFHYIQQNNRIFQPQKVYSIRTLPSVNYNGHNNVLLLDIANYRKQGYTVILCAGNNEQGNKLNAILSENRMSAVVASRMTMCQLGSINIVIKKYPLDIILPEEKLAVISFDSLFGRAKRVVKQIEQGFFDGEVPTEGDYVVHNFHGVGKCLGVKTLNISTVQRDYVVIEYKNNDKVYLPVENLNQLSKYIGSDKAPQVNKIGGVEFAKTKEKIKSAVKKIAFDLIALYRDRMNLKGYKYSQDEDMQVSFEKSFGFDETADQLKAINDCKQDMQDGKVMDRLVCGDVGFGKTEVALRIAFKTILAGKQVVFLCPTTILSEQHFNTAKSRMTNFGVKVEVLNRLRNAKDVEKIKKDFQDGKIDMLCGTHKLLSSSINYKNLGLLILDEEQKFGVADKEKIKNMKKNINVLTLSATPIPRTLNMSLMGVRDISVIETPPVQRIPSDVQVIEYSDSLLKTAIERELARDGQVLIIYNRVEKIYNFASKIRAMVSDAVVSVAHGQMSESELEKEIFALYSGKTQVLVATTLIENGVDLPNANTLIVINSDMLGLSQLYQLKGRIGRSDKSSYAYFTFDNRKLLTETAYKRLQAIKEFSQMGSGFKIAMRDLEIRGAGSLLGAEQSGHIEKIGYNMYVNLLSESEKELKGEDVSRVTNIKVETGFSAYLPYDYIKSSHHRMSLYRDISRINSLENLENVVTRIEENWGTVPEELMALCKIALIKNILSQMGVERISINKLTKIYFESKENLTKKIIDLLSVREDLSLNIEKAPILELKLNLQENPFDQVLNFVFGIVE